MSEHDASVAARVLGAAIADEQHAHHIDPEDDIPAIRGEIRRLARIQGVSIRTGLIRDGVLAVIRSDAALWHQPTRVMEDKLTPAPPSDRSTRH